MGNICWQCGDIGISEALQYCSRCKSNPRHSYCLDELLFNYCLDELPEDHSAEISWLCEDCMIKSPNFTSKAKFPECSPRLLLHDLGRTTIGPKDACQIIGDVNDHSVNPQDQHLITNVRIVSSVNLDNHVSYDAKKETLSCRNGGEPGTVSPSSCTELSEDDGIGEYGKENLERKSFMPLEKDESGKSIHPVDSQDTDIQFEAKRSPVTSVEAHDMQIIKQTSNFDTGGLGAGRSSPCYGPREDEIINFEKGGLRRRGSTLLAKEYLDSFRPLVDGKRRRRGKRSRLILLSKLDNYHFLFDGKGTNSSFAVQNLPCTPVEPFGKEIIERPTSCTTYRGTERSSIRYKKKRYKFGKYRKNISKVKKSKLPAKDEFGNYYPYGQSTNVSCTVKRVSITSVEPYNIHAMGRTSTGDVNVLTPIKSSACFGRLIPQAKVHSTSEDDCASASSSIEPSACFELKPVQAGHCKEKLLRRKYIKSGMKLVDSTQPLSDGQNISIEALDSQYIKSGMKLVDSTQPLSDGQNISIEALDSQGIDASDAVRSSCIPPAMEDQMRVKIMIPPAKGESDNDLETNILFASDRQTEVEINQYGKEKTDRRRLILNDNNDFSSLHIDSQGGSKMFADKSLPGGTVVISDLKTGWRTDMNDQMNFSCPQTFCSLPIVSHVWRGTFNINKREFGPFRAHLSSRACEKVCNFARKLPLVLYMQMLPRLVGWPNSFKVSAPTDDSVALYFSPDSDRAESSLDEVVDDIINNDLMLRFQFDEVELLVFSSFVLPQKSQILYGKYYAWGVFKRRSAQVCSSPAVSHALPDGVAKRNEVKGNADTLLLKDRAEEINYLPFGGPSIRPK